MIQSETEAIIIEAGVGLIAAKKALDFNISKVAACLVTHEHGDHAKYAADYSRVFLTYAPASVIAAKRLTGATEVKPLVKYKVGLFTILPFMAHHDVPCMGYVISHPEMGNLMFLTDSFMCEYSFKGLNHVMLECNYTDRALGYAIDNGITQAWEKRRLMTTHMELQTTKQVLLNQDLSGVNTITLIHMSGRNSDKNEITGELAGVFGKPIVIASTGLKIDLNLSPY
ncbi:MAG: MBL fold metallo-hydrolase [Bacteroidales bacterium]|nr:MBL fold metallo-hydrolase [Bacteroidales bacterium]